jgi:hypothetical protein
MRALCLRTLRLAVCILGHAFELSVKDILSGSIEKFQLVRLHLVTKRLGKILNL